MKTKLTAAPIGGSACVLPGPCLLLGVTLPGRYQPRPRLSSRYRLDQPWEPHRLLARVPMPGTAGSGPSCTGTLVVATADRPADRPARKAPFLICPRAAGRRGLPNGVQLGFMGVQLGGKVTGAGWRREAGAAGSSARGVVALS